MDLRGERNQIEQRLYDRREERFEDDSNSTRLIMAERAAREALEAFDTAHPEIIAEIRIARAEQIKREYNETAASRGTECSRNWRRSSMPCGR